MEGAFKTDLIEVNGVSVNKISTELELIDILGAVKVRWGFGRDNYRVSPGIYAVGSPCQSSDVFVTGNYKLSFDNLRKNLKDIDGWILVLDTKGVNVWCAAGKGTFGTNELVNRIRRVSLHTVVSHRRLILPQLGATGVAAHKVKEETGFNVHYGPVKAADIKKFITDGYRASKEMRRITFGLSDRLKLIPNDFMYGKYYLFISMAAVFLISGITGTGISLQGFQNSGTRAVVNVFLAYIAGIVITPALLPYIPGKPFSLKGFISGQIVFLLILIMKFAGDNIFEIISWFFIISAVSSFMAMNFTGSSTYTSLSGVKKEMKYSLPVQIGFAVSGIILLIIGKLN